MKRRLLHRDARVTFLSGALALAVPSFVYADLVNTALLSYRDSAGINQQRVSNTVTVVVDVPLSAPSAPTLSLPAYLPIDGQISVSNSGSIPVSSYSWSFIPVTSNASLRYQARTLSAAPSATLNTSGAQVGLRSLNLGLGPYVVTVTAYGATGLASASAEAHVTFVSANLSSVHVYPNPWRQDRHTSSLPITFDGLSLNTHITLFTVSGHAIKTLPTSNTSITWDLTNDSGEKVASGTYLYVMTTDQGDKKTGRIVIIK